MSLILSAELAATCNALGSFDTNTNTYFSDENTLETVKDLIRYLRRDNESHDIRRQLGDTKVLQTDLIPLLKLHWKEVDLFDVLIRLLGNLTSPVLLLYNEEIPTDKTVRNQFLQILAHLQAYKESFTDDDVWAVLCTRLGQLLSIESDERGEDNGLLIERILILIRNVLNVPADRELEKRTDNDVSTHDKVVWALQRSGILDIVLYMLGCGSEEPYYTYLLEIVALVLREQEPCEIARAAPARSVQEKVRDEAELLAFRHRETVKRQEKMKKYNAARHSRFGGTYTVKNMASITDANELIYHKPLGSLDTLDLDTNKQKAKTPKNRLPAQSTSESRRSTYSIRLFLKDFCIELLNGAYNKVMCNVRGKLMRSKMVHDETYYLWTMRFFMEFNRCYKFDIKLVSETMSIPIFHYVQQQMENHFEMLQSDKKKGQVWAKRLHVALQAYRELLLTLAHMDRSEDRSVRESAGVIKGNVFYVVEYREFILTLLLTYNPLKMTKEYLVDLMETQHVFLKMLQLYCSGGIVVQKKNVAKKKRKKKTVVQSTPEEVVQNLESQWDEVAPQITVILETGANIPEEVPFDAASEVDIDDQKADAMVRIQNHLRANELETAIGLLRAAREVWPENDSFGNSAMAPEEEFLAIREIFFAELQSNAPVKSAPAAVVEEEDDEEDDEEEDEMPRPRMETDFQFLDFIKRFAHPKIVQACASLLRDFSRNSVNTNHCVLKLLHRIVWDCKMSAMLYQASVFRTFQQVFEEKGLPQHKELVKFATYIIRQFVKCAQKNPKVYMEILFWKNSREAYDVEEGYGSYQEKSTASKIAWSEAEENELRTLFMEHRENQESQDVVDWILKNLVDNTRTRRAVIKKLKDLMLLDYKGPTKKSMSSRPPKDWQEQEVAQLTQLFEEFREATDPLSCILDRLDVKRPKKRVADKIVELGLVLDRKELRKKRSRKSQKSGFDNGGDSGSDLDDSSASEDETNVKSAKSKPSASTNGHRSASSRKPSKSSKGGTTRKATATEIAKLLMDVVQKGFSDSLTWIQESVAEAADDLEQEIDLDSNEGVPLVAIADSDVVAMENPGFTKMLLSLGMQKPQSEQESYWRIPAYLTVNELRKISDVITEAIEGRLSIPEDTPSVDTSKVANDKDESSDDEYVFSNLRTSINKDKATNSKDEASQSNEIADSQKMKDEIWAILRENIDNSPPRKKKGVLTSDSEEESTNNGESSNINGSSQEPSSDRKKKRKKIAINSDSEDEADVATIGESSNANGPTASPQPTNDRKKKRTTINSDSEDEMDASNLGESNNANGPTTTQQPTNDRKKKRTTVNSDSEDEMADSNLGEFSNANGSTTSQQPSSDRKKKQTINSDSEDGIVNLGESSNINGSSSSQPTPDNPKKKKQKIIINSDSEDEVVDTDLRNDDTLPEMENGKRRLDSNSESDSHETGLKKKRMILSDDDD